MFFKRNIRKRYQRKLMQCNQEWEIVQGIMRGNPWAVPLNIQGDDKKIRKYY